MLKVYIIFWKIGAFHEASRIKILKLALQVSILVKVLLFGILAITTFDKNVCWVKFLETCMSFSMNNFAKIITVKKVKILWKKRAAMDIRSAAAPNNIKIKLLLFVTTHYKKGAKTKILPLRNTTLVIVAATGQRGDFFFGRYTS